VQSSSARLSLDPRLATSTILPMEGETHEPKPPVDSTASKALYIFGPMSGFVGPGGNCRV
jgi:hypothetical protein